MKHTPLYIIHGWTYTTSHWDQTLDIMKRDGYPTIMLHVPGLTEPSTRVFTIDDYVKWADKHIPKGAIALGHSNGGRILMNLLIAKPEKLSHLILLSSAGIYEKSRKRDLVRAVAKIGAPLKRVPLFRKIFHKLTGASDYDAAPANMKTTLTNMLTSDKKLHPERITTPTTILWGEADTTTPLRQGQALHDRIQNSTMRTYKNWTHAPYISDPAGLASALERTIDDITEVK